jgi:hypothetical protein
MAALSARPARQSSRIAVFFWLGGSGARSGFSSVSALSTRHCSGTVLLARNFEHSLLRTGSHYRWCLGWRPGWRRNIARTPRHGRAPTSPTVPSVSGSLTHRRGTNSLFAKQLIHETRMPMTEIALAAGFGSLRRFNEIFRDPFHRSPGALRRKTSAHPVHAVAGVTLRVRYRLPYDWDSMLSHLQARAIPGIDARIVRENFWLHWTPVAQKISRRVYDRERLGPSERYLRNSDAHLQIPDDKSLFARSSAVDVVLFGARLC